MLFLFFTCMVWGTTARYQREAAATSETEANWKQTSHGPFASKCQLYFQWRGTVRGRQRAAGYLLISLLAPLCSASITVSCFTFFSHFIFLCLIFHLSIWVINQSITLRFHQVEWYGDNKACNNLILYGIERKSNEKDMIYTLISVKNYSNSKSSFTCLCTLTLIVYGEGCVDVGGLL